VINFIYTVKPAYKNLQTFSQAVLTGYRRLCETWLQKICKPKFIWSL